MASIDEATTSQSPLSGLLGLPPYLPLGTVKARMFHGMQALRSVLGKRGFNTA